MRWMLGIASSPVVNRKGSFAYDCCRPVPVYVCPPGYFLLKTFIDTVRNIHIAEEAGVLETIVAPRGDNS